MVKIKNRKTNLGVALIIIGFLWILSNFNVIDIDLYNIFRHLVNGIFDLWPLIFIVVGISMIFKNDLLNTILWILFLVIVLSYSFFLREDIPQGDNIISKEETNIVQMGEDIEKGRLDLNIGASNFKIESIEDDFLKMEHDGAFKYRSENKDSIESVYITNDNIFPTNNLFKRNTSNRNLDIGINKDIPWEFKMDVGAISGNLDLKDILVNYIILDMGAGDLDISLGDKNDFTSINIDAGASKLILNVPRDVGLKIDLDGGLNSTNLDSLNLIRKNEREFISENYEDKISKYEIEVDMGVGQFEINYY